MSLLSNVEVVNKIKKMFKLFVSFLILMIVKVRNFMRRRMATLFTFIVKINCMAYQNPVRVNSFSKVTRKTKLGKNVNFNGMRITGLGNVTIGDNFHSGRDCLIISQFHNYNHGTAIPYDNTYVIKDVRIKDNVWLGDRVIILGGVTLGEGCIIQAGSVVVKDVPEFAIAGGHPAKVFAYRDIEHYLDLKSQGKFN
jgi:chloramphenicol O-acetyltransferase type B